MTLEEVRNEIDEIDTNMKPLFLRRMKCGKHVAEVKGQNGGDVFDLERELAVVEKRAGNVDPEIRGEYEAFLRHLMSLCRKYEYELLPEMQGKVISDALKAAGLNEEIEHSRVKITFQCLKDGSNLNTYLNMINLNEIQIEAMNLETKNGVQKVVITLDGKITDSGMRCLLCQIGKEAEGFRILELIAV